MNNGVYIGLGSNLGDSRDYLIRAIQQVGDLICDYLKTTISASALYHSEPVGFTDQPWFLNQVIAFNIDKGLPPLALLKILRTIETQLGRRPTFRYGPRAIDLDLLFYQNWVFESAELTIPHPKITERSFVLMPLAELDPTMVHPRLGLSISQILLNNRAQLTFCQKEEN